MTSAVSDPLLVTSGFSAGGLALRAALREVRWWLALRGTDPADRPEIIRALYTPRAPRSRKSP
jgi:hypothetical protein